MAPSISLATQELLHIAVSWVTCGIYAIDPAVLSILAAALFEVIGFKLLETGNALFEHYDLLGSINTYSRPARLIVMSSLTFAVQWYRAQTLRITIPIGKSVVRPAPKAYFYCASEFRQKMYHTQLNPITPMSVYKIGDSVREKLPQTTKKVNIERDNSTETIELYPRCIIELTGEQPRDLKYRIVTSNMSRWGTSYHKTYGFIEKTYVEIVDLEFIPIKTWFSPMLATLLWLSVKIFLVCTKCIAKFDYSEEVHTFLTPILWGYIDKNEGNPSLM